MPEFVRVASASDFSDGDARCVKIGERRLALFRVGERFYALDDECTHQGAPLSEGSIDGLEVECPWHMSRFELETGRVKQSPADEDVHSYPVRLNGDDVEVGL